MQRIGSILLALGVLLGGLVSPAISQAHQPSLRIAGTIVGSLAEKLTVQAVAQDPYFSQQWYLGRLQVPSAWDITTGGNQTIAVIDTGINANHPDLLGRIWVNSDEIPANGRDDDNNGYIDDVNGFNFVGNNSDLTDGHGHGTGISSIIAANTNNGSGIAGINRQAKIMVAKALDTAGGGEYANVIRATRYAVDNGASIINMSFGAAAHDPSLEEVISYANSRNVIIVAASGNAGRQEVYYPAAYPSVIAVGSITRNDSQSTFSNTGSQLDVVAPGEGILMAGNSGGYVEAAGSSFSSAQVTGVISLLLSVAPGQTPSQVMGLLRTTSSRIGGTVPSPQFGYGVPNAQALVNRPKANLNAQFTFSPGSVVANGVDAVNVTASLTANGQPQPNTPLSLQVSGSGNIINGQPSSTLSSLVTNSQGQVNFQLSSVVAESKTLSLTSSSGTVTSTSSTLSFRAPLRPLYQMQWIGQSPYPTVQPGQQAQLTLDVKNTGNIAWHANPNQSSDNAQMRLGTDRRMDRQSIFYNSSQWISGNRVGLMTPSIVKPGEIGRFIFTIQAPLAVGTHKEYFRPVIERVAWLNDLGIYWAISVGSSMAGGNLGDPSGYQAQVVSQSSNINLSRGSAGTVTVELRNTGTTTWSPTGTGNGLGQVKLGTANLQDRLSKFFAPSWISANRVSGTGVQVPPGQTFKLTFAVVAPLTPGTYTETFQLVSEHVAWFGPKVSWSINVS